MYKFTVMSDENGDVKFNASYKGSATHFVVLEPLQQLFSVTSG